MNDNMDVRIEERGRQRNMVYYLRKIRGLILMVLLLHVFTVAGIVWFVLYVYGLI